MNITLQSYHTTSLQNISISVYIKEIQLFHCLRGVEGEAAITFSTTDGEAKSTTSKLEMSELRLAVQPQFAPSCLCIMM